MRIPTGTPVAGPPTGVNDMALASLLAAGVTWVIGWFGGCLAGWILPGTNLCTGLIGLIATVVGIVTGHIGLQQTGPGSAEAESRWMAVVGLALNYASIAVLVVGLCALLIVFVLTGATLFTVTDWSQLLSATPGP